MKNSKSNLALILIVFLAAIIGLSMFNFLSSTKEEVYLFNDDYEVGKEISQSMLISESYDGDLVRAVGQSTGSFYVTAETLNEIIGTKLKTDVYKGMPLMSTMSDEYGGSGIEKRLALNMVGVSVPVDNVTSSNPLLSYGSRVNIYATYQALEEVVTETFQNVKVIEVLYSSLDIETTGTPSVCGVVVEMPLENSIQLNNLTEFATVRLGTVSIKGYKEADIKPYLKTFSANMPDEE